jgi:hypothetical protein
MRGVVLRCYTFFLFESEMLNQYEKPRCGAPVIFIERSRPVAPKVQCTEISILRNHVAVRCT